MRRVVAPHLLDEAERLSALSLPYEKQAQMRAVLAAYEDAIVEARTDPAAFAEADNPYAAIEEQAEELKLTACPL